MPLNKKPAKKAISSRQYLVLLGLVLVLFVWATRLASQQAATDWELSIFEHVYNWPSWLYPVFLLATQFGNALIVLIVAAAYLVRKKLSLSSTVLITGGLTYGFVLLAKELIARPRPVHLLSDVMQREVFVQGYGYPSGHTAIATALALTLFSVLPKRHRWLVVVWLVLVPLSRLYLAVHMPLDLIGGYAIGIGVYCIIRMSYSRSSNKRPKRA